MTAVAQWLRAGLVRVLPIVLLVALWWAVVRGFELPSRLMPAPLEVWQRIYAGLVTQGDLWPHLATTLLTTLGGYALGCVLAIALGSVLAMNRVLELTFYPVVLLIQSVPKVAIAPLVLLWMGFTTRSTVVLVALTCFSPCSWVPSWGCVQRRLCCWIFFAPSTPAASKPIFTAICPARPVRSWPACRWVGASRWSAALSWSSSWAWAAQAI